MRAPPKQDGLGTTEAISSISPLCILALDGSGFLSLRLVRVPLINLCWRVWSERQQVLVAWQTGAVLPIDRFAYLAISVAPRASDWV